MATDAQVSEWTTWGGTVEQKKARGKASQVFVAPSGWESKCGVCEWEWILG